jgi:hypothetical protein
MNQLSMFEATARDRALDLLEKHRGDLVAVARSVANRIAIRNGTVTSPEVLAEMRAIGLGDALDTVDRRFMGCVFRTGWKRVGYSPEGSHKRPVAVWQRRP